MVFDTLMDRAPAILLWIILGPKKLTVGASKPLSYEDTYLLLSAKVMCWWEDVLPNARGSADIGLSVRVT